MRKREIEQSKHEDFVLTLVGIQIQTPLILQSLCIQGFPCQSLGYYGWIDTKMLAWVQHQPSSSSVLILN